MASFGITSIGRILNMIKKTIFSILINYLILFFVFSRLKAFATQSLPSFTRQLEVPQVVCPEVCPQVLEVCQVQVHPPVQDPDPLSKRSTNMFSFG